MHHTRKAKEVVVVGEVEDVVAAVVVQSPRIKWPSLLLILCKNVTQHKHMKVFNKKIICLSSRLSK